VNERELTLMEQNESTSTAETLPRLLTSFTAEQIRFVVETWKSYKQNRKRVRKSAFVKELKRRWHQQPWLTPAPSRQTVSDMLRGNGVDPVKSEPKGQRYSEPVKKFFPNAQLCLDGKEIDIELNDNMYRFTVEMAKDLASDAITANEFGKTETAELVKNAFAQHQKNYGHAMSLLVDNGSGNKKASVDLGQEGVLVIRAFPRQPETKGQLEGEFGRFERLTHPIQLQGNDDETLTLSVAKSIVEIYAQLRNQTPRCQSCPFTPEELMKYQAGDLQLASAYDFLRTRQEVKKAQKEKRLKLSQEHRELMESVAKEQKLSGDMLTFKKALKFVESSTIRDAECDFFVYTKRDDFDESKRCMAYFCGIARNLQNNKDQQRKNEIAQRRFGLDQKARKNREEIKVARLDFVRRQELEKKPWLPLIENLKSEFNLPTDFKHVAIFRKNIDRTLSLMLGKTKKRYRTMIDKTEYAIMNLAEFPLDKRFAMVEFVKERVEILSNSQAKTVTP
jgi:hypothetical protein